MSFNKKIAVDEIVCNWLPWGEEHLVRSQRKELMKLDDDLIKVIKLVKPVEEVSNYAFNNDSEFRTAILRLAKRRRINQEIEKAKAEGLYEVSEHLTSEIDLEYEKLSEEQLKFLHGKSIYNRSNIEASRFCGCFYCKRIFPNYDIKEWVDPQGDTALCPSCGIDAVLPDSITRINASVLHQMHEHYFLTGTTYKMINGEMVEVGKWDGRKKT